MLHSAALSVSEVAILEALTCECAASAGARLFGNLKARSLLQEDSSVAGVAKSHLGDDAIPVRAVLFDKNPGSNWTLGWHQDRTIVVQERADMAGYGPWSTKSSMQHVEPPFSLFESMITVRIHLDAVDTNNGPLLIAPGSHKFGRISVEQVQDVVSNCGVYSCFAKPGDVWVYRTPILHASESSKSPGRRRVLQADFCSKKLPEGLAWLGV